MERSRGANGNYERKLLLKNRYCLTLHCVHPGYVAQQIHNDRIGSSGNHRRLVLYTCGLRSIGLIEQRQPGCRRECNELAWRCDSATRRGKRRYGYGCFLQRRVPVISRKHNPAVQFGTESCLSSPIHN
jgi:hypothetical protein